LGTTGRREGAVSSFTGRKGKKLKFAERVGTGFNVKLLRSLSADFDKIRVADWPFFNVPAKCRNRWDQGLTAAEMKRCHWVAIRLG
jgi:bifunctional non-homologous end joining protein LigD